MKKILLAIKLIVIPALLMFIAGCMEDDMRPVTAFNTSGNGIFIVCEGNFMYGNSSLAYYDLNSREITNQAFLQANGIPLGDVAQSLLMHNDLLWISINNSGKLYVIEPDSFLFRGKISGLSSPRYMLPLSENEIWVSDLYSGHIHIIESSSFSKTGEISLNRDNNGKHNAEQMIRYGNQVICNSWSYDNHLFFIDIASREITDSLEVRWQPSKLCLDRNEKLWVLSDGGYEGSPFGKEAAALQRINPENGEILSSFVFSETDRPADICLNPGGDSIYLINKDVYCFPVEADHIGKPVIDGDQHNFYGIRAGEQELILSDAKNYMEPGNIFLYNRYFELTDSASTGINPADFVFE
ncbi:MAG: YncE family protein [Bacteroidales bacterium]